MKKAESISILKAKDNKCWYKELNLNEKVLPVIITEMAKINPVEDPNIEKKFDQILAYLSFLDKIKEPKAPIKKADNTK